MSNFPSERVLVVDDDDSEVSVLRSILEPLRVEATSTRSLEGVQQSLQQGDYAFVLLATGATSFAAADVVRLIRSDPGTAQVPIMFLSDSRERVQALIHRESLEGNDLALKPIDAGLLRAKASAFVELHRNAAQVRRLAEQLRAARCQSERLQTRAAFSDRLLEARQRSRPIEGILHATLPMLGDAAILTLLENGGVQKWRVSALLASPHKLQLDDWRFELVPSDVIRTAKRLALLDTSVAGPEGEHPNTDLLRELGVGGCLCLPLVASGRILGAIMFLKAGQDRYSAEDLELAEDLCQRLALTLEDLRLQEIANRERAELEAAGRAKDAYLATLSHELRTPLNAIVGWANILASGQVDGGRRAHAVDTIDRNARALASLIADLVDHNGASPWQTDAGPAANGNVLPELLSGIHALVVEDDPDSSELVETILRRFGADVTCVATVRAALGALAVRKPDVLVSDIGLPDDDGLTLIRRIRETQELAALPAIALSAYASRRDVSQALAAGFQAYIAKPVEPDQLGRIIADVVNG